MVAAALAVGVVAAALLAGVWLRHNTTDVRTGARPTGEPEADEPSGTGGYFNVDGHTPAAFPETKLGLAFLQLDEPLARAVGTLGPPTAAEPDIFGTARTWRLAGDASLTVSAWDDTRTINGLYASVPPPSTARLGVFGGVVIGQSSLRDVVSAWGEAFTAPTSPLDDFVVSYIECIGPYPVVVKFDQLAATDAQFVPAAGSRLWDDPVTSVLIAYADEPAGSGGCSA